MIHPEIAKEIQEIGAFFSERKKNLATEDPEACVLSLLKSIRGRLDSVSAMLGSTIERGLYTELVNRERERLDKANREERISSD